MTICQADGAIPLIKTIADRAYNRPRESGLIIIGSDAVENRLSNADVYHDALKAGGVLVSRGLGQSDRVLIILPHSRALIAAFWGALAVGAVPSILPDQFAYTKSRDRQEQFLALVQHLGVSAVVVSDQHAVSLSQWLSIPDVDIIALTPDVEHSGFSCEPLVEPNFDHCAVDAATAYIQCSSATTGARKGAKLSNNAIAACIGDFAERLHIHSRDVGANWLPLYHDYGLFAGLLTPVLCGLPAILMAPSLCIRRPEEFLHAVARHKATLSWITNSGYHLFAKKTRDVRLHGLDLQSLRIICCGGEPIHHASQQMFLERFESYGLKVSAMLSGYGMTETTMAVSVGEANAGPHIDWVDGRELSVGNKALPVPQHFERALPVVSCGPMLARTLLRIVDDAGDSVGDRVIGSIWLNGPSLFTGYVGVKDEEPAGLDGGWHVTGDIGYVAEGELYVVGRGDDVIIINGQNVNPIDIETLADASSGAVVGRTVAFSVPDCQTGTDKIVLMIGVSKRPSVPELHAWEIALRNRIMQTLGVSIGEIHFTSKGWIVKTANGKMRRKANRSKYIREAEMQ